MAAFSIQVVCAQGHTLPESLLQLQPRKGAMTRTHDYKIISDTAPAIETALAAQSAEGWRPILMSTAAINTAVQVFIVLEKPIPSPYAK
jgi:hypothetical protein